MNATRARAAWRLVFDVALTAVMAYTAWSLLLEVSRSVELMAPTWLLLALATVHVAPILVRRRWPVAALAVSLGAAVGVMAAGLPIVRLGPALLVLVYASAAGAPRRRSVPSVLITLGAVALSIPLGGYGFDLVTAGWFSALVLGAWLLGDAVRQREAATAAMAERAAQLEEARGELARAAVAAERLRVARELHDIVAHGLSVIAVHAGSGRLAAGRDPAAAAAALATIERTSRSTLDEMRGLLGVLREQGAEAETAPLPDLGALPDLIASFAEAGLPVSLEVTGDLTPLPLGVHLTAYRLVQEALTNVLKHAGSVETTVRVAAQRDALELEVHDHGDATASPRGDGHGTLGMRERVAVYGGELTIGPAADGGWTVAARVPLTGVPA